MYNTESLKIELLKYAELSGGRRQMWSSVPLKGVKEQN